MPNSISEWFGHRVYPTVAGTSEAQCDQKRGSCPFLTRALHEEKSIPCIKPPNSRGVCTVSSNSNGTQQDWVVCPYRTIDSGIFAHTAKRLFGLQSNDTSALVSAPRLKHETDRKAVIDRLKGRLPVFIFFMGKQGGEIDLPGSLSSPAFKLDTTIVELRMDENGAIDFGRYAVVEVQTMDFHGSYRIATKSLTNALELHPNDFAAQLINNPKWAAEGIQSPNISNVFKRTMYQILFKLRLGHQPDCAGCVLALPHSVWESWQPHLGAPRLTALPDGTWQLGGRKIDLTTKQPGWLTVFDVNATSGTSPNPIMVRQDIRIDASLLSKLAFDIAPEEAMRHIGGDIGLKTLIRRRMADFWPEAFKLSRRR